jgi:broad specificity phosphatase PhoE
MEKISSNTESNEAMKEYSSKIDLHFFRHGKKQSSDSAEYDKDILLTPEGRQQARNKASLEYMRQSMAFGSHRARAQETAGIVMAGNVKKETADEPTDLLTGNESLSELKTKLNEGISYGTKLMSDKHLEFNLEGDNPYVKKATEAFEDGYFVKFLVEQSDAMAKEFGDKESSTYTSLGQSMASLIRKYIGIAPHWDELVKDKSKAYEDTLNRFFGTHQGVLESFLAKVIELTRGNDERDRFVQLVNNQGFAYVEGFDVEIITAADGSGTKVYLHYDKKGDTPEKSFIFDEFIPIKLIDQILSEKV